MSDLGDQHLVRGVDHAAFPTFDPAGTVRFYRDTLGFPVVHSICAAGWGPENHPDFIHFFFDIGGGDRIAFFYYFGLEPPQSGAKGDVYARFDADVPEFFVRSRHLALHVDTEDHMLEYRRRLDASEWPVEMQIQHETIESIYTHDPNGYMVEITRAMRPVMPQEDLDATLTIDALVDIVQRPGAGMDDLLVRKAELIVERAERWERERVGATGAGHGITAPDGAAAPGLAVSPEGPVSS
ncbi:VOC family protein [Nocardioides sp. CPCC 205120]|uniref:VOC family protein n=1 Tax=Nocardioides sp. CPCC 205120 TaxID=3406462 RepID=UPI003B5085B2